MTRIKHAVCEWCHRAIWQGRRTGFWYHSWNASTACRPGAATTYASPREAS